MGRWSYGNKDEADYLTKLEVSFLKKYGYFTQGYRSGTMTWTRNGGKSNEHTSRISVSSAINEFGRNMHLNYTLTKQDGEKKEIDYDMRIEGTPCNYGGLRYWFICPLFKDGRYCGRRVGTLYLGGDYFACRHCYDLTYQSKNKDRRSSHALLFSVLDVAAEMEKLEAKIKRPYYRGKPTRKQRRLERLRYQKVTNYVQYAQRNGGSLV